MVCICLRCLNILLPYNDDRVIYIVQWPFLSNDILYKWIRAILNVLVGTSYYLEVPGDYSPVLAPGFQMLVVILVLHNDYSVVQQAEVGSDVKLHLDKRKPHLTSVFDDKS